MQKGFTLIELIMIIVILGILAAVAVPKYFDLQAQAKVAAEKGVVGGVRAGLYTFFAQYKYPPTTLDLAALGACTTANPCFGIVLAQGGITADWTKVSSLSYTGPAGNTYTWNAFTQEFK